MHFLAVYIQGVDNLARNNLVTMVVFPGTYNGKQEKRIEWAAGFETIDAVRPVLSGNVVAGSERAGFRVDGEPCTATTERWSNNLAHSALVGVYTLPEDGIPTCGLISNFTVYKTYDFGVFYEAEASLEVSGIVSYDNQIGLFPMVIKPGASQHQFANKYITVRDSLFVGTTSAFDCNVDLMDTSSLNIEFSGAGRSFSSGGGGKVGIVGPTFSSGSNKAAKKPWINIMAYQAISGLMTVSDVTLANFGSYSCSGSTISDVAFMVPPNNDDTIHPLRTQRLTLNNVNDKVYFSRPRLS